MQNKCWEKLIFAFVEELRTIMPGPIRASPPRGSICYFWAYDNLFSNRTKKVSPTANLYYIFLCCVDYVYTCEDLREIASG
jgi:hypothetical protein